MYIFRNGGEPVELPVDTLKNNSFDNVSFQKCILTNLDMSGSSFMNCDFRDAETKCTIFKNTNLEKARLIMMESTMADYRGANLKETLIISSDFSGGSFNGANLTASRMSKVNFVFCDLRGAILDSEGLETCKFNDAVFDKNTIWADGFNPIQNGAKLVDETYSGGCSNQDSVVIHLMKYLNK